MPKRDELLPMDIRAEEAVLGCVLLARGDDWPECEAALRMLKSADFYREKHAWIWEAIKAVAGHADGVTVGAKLRAAGRLEDAGGYGYLSELVASVPTPYHAEHYARIVKDLAERRRAIIEAGKKAGEAWEGKLAQIKPIYEE